jgi:tetratricopeptide (TPR) repeat protein
MLVMLACTSKEERLTGYLERAEAYFENEQWSEAKIEYLNVLQLDPENPAAHFQMAKALWALQQYGDALWGYKEAVRLAPENAEYRMQLAEVLFIARDYEGVGTNVDVLLEADPGHIGALLLRAKVARVQAGVDREFEALEAILGVDADHTGALAMKAQALATRGDTEAAEEVLQQLIQIEPGLATHLLYGAFLSTEDRGDEALLQFQAAVEAATEADERTRARLILTHFHLNRGEADAAEAQLLKAREETPDNANILLTLAQFYALRGQPEQAEAMLEERVTTLPDDETPLLVLADFHRRMGDHEKALESVERALALDPRSEQARLRKAEYLLGLFAKEVETEKSEEAKRLIEEVLEENPNSSLALFTEGKLLISEGRYEEAGTRLRRVVEEQPTANAHVLLGSTYLNLEQYELARGEFLRALQLDSAHHLARVQLVALYLKMGDRTLAAREAQAALERRPGDTQMLLARAEALTGLGQQEGALAALRSIEFDEKASEQLRLSAAGLYRANGALDDARKTLEAIRGGSDDPEVVAELARVDVLSGDAQAAIHRLDQAIARSPENVDLYQYRGSMYLGFHRSGKLQFPEEAERDFRTVLEKDIGRSEAHVLLGALYRQIGREEEALESYRSALQIDTTNSDVYLALAQPGSGDRKEQPGLDLGQRRETERRGPRPGFGARTRREGGPAAEPQCRGHARLGDVQEGASGGRDLTFSGGDRGLPGQPAAARLGAVPPGAHLRT